MRKILYIALLAVGAATVLSFHQSPARSMEMSAEVASAVLDEVTTKNEPAAVLFEPAEYTWIETVYEDGSIVKPKDPYAFTLSFSNDRVVVTSDCNSGVSSYEANEAGMFTFGIPALTKRSCTGSQEAEYLTMLDAVRKYTKTENGVLVLELRDNLGHMRFE